MKLACVLTSCTIDQPYYGCLPLFIQTWRKLYPEVKVKVVFIHETLPAELEPYREHLIHFPPLLDVPIKFTSQYIRLLYPAVLNEEGGVMITDVDLLPMNRRIFNDSIRHVADNAFVSDKEPYQHLVRWFQTFADDNVTELREMERRTGILKQIPIAYNVASSRVWGDVFGVRTAEDVSEKLISVYEKYRGKTNVWFIDQKDLHQAVKAWNSKTGGYVCLPYRPLLSRLLFESLQLRLYHDTFPKKMFHDESSGLSLRFFRGLLYLCVKLECFIDYAVLPYSKQENWDCAKKITGWLSSKPLPFSLTLFRPLGILAWKTMFCAIGLVWRIAAMNRRTPEL